MSFLSLIALDNQAAATSTTKRSGRPTDHRRKLPITYSPPPAMPSSENSTYGYVYDPTTSPIEPALPNIGLSDSSTSVYTSLRGTSACSQ